VPALVPLRYGRMSLSPLAFYRGCAGVMASDLAETPATGIQVQLGGDAHLSNFGAFGTPEGAIVFDLNDFDETLPGPWEWDVKRLAASLVLACRVNGYSRRKARRTAERAVRSYRRTMAGYAFEPYLEIWRTHLDLEELPGYVARRAKSEVDSFARDGPRHTSLHAFPKLARSRGSEARIRDDPPLILHYADAEGSQMAHTLFDRYLTTLPPDRRLLLDRYRPADVAQRVVGVGSVGTICSVLLLLGDPRPIDPIFLQVKQALPSALEPFAGASPFENHAERVVVGQRLMQQASDPFLGWSSLHGQDFYIRELWDFKASVDPSTMTAKQLAGHGEFCAAALARAHARTGDPARIAGYLGGSEAFDEAVGEFAVAYADQVERDFREFTAAIADGRLPAKVDV
jgi:uncharacterized protein (DUF2252 family)